MIREVNKETRGAQVLVSRSTPVFVRRLFEREVPEIYQGTIEIKAIAREAGERCKIAVYSHNENIDPIGACIGPRGQRVQTIINELNGEKIDIFEWSDNISELIQNALSPSESVAVFKNPNVDDGLVVVVPDNQLSLAIGKRGKNARLAVRLSNHKIDIKSVSEMEENGVDYMALSQQMQDEYNQKKAEERAYKQELRIEELKNQDSDLESVELPDFEYDDEPEEAEIILTDSESEEAVVQEEAPVQEEVVIDQPQKEEDDMEIAARIAKEARSKERASEVKEYTSKFENFADASHKEEVKTVKKKVEEPKKKEEPKEEKKPQFEQMKPIYSDEELAEIEAEEEYEDNRWDDDVDYEEYDEYYD